MASPPPSRRARSSRRVAGLPPDRVQMQAVVAGRWFEVPSVEETPAAALAAHGSGSPWQVVPPRSTSPVQSGQPSNKGARFPHASRRATRVAGAPRRTHVHESTAGEELSHAPSPVHTSPTTQRFSQLVPLPGPYPSGGMSYAGMTALHSGTYARRPISPTSTGAAIQGSGVDAESPSSSNDSPCEGRPESKAARRSRREVASRARHAERILHGLADAFTPYPSPKTQTPAARRVRRGRSGKSSRSRGRSDGHSSESDSTDSSADRRHELKWALRNAHKAEEGAPSPTGHGTARSPLRRPNPEVLETKKNGAVS